MRVLVACEFSGTVRQAFRALGHDAWSCDLLPGGKTARRANQTASGQNRLPPSPDRWKLRSLTYPGIAQAMAAQWGGATDAR